MYVYISRTFYSSGFTSNGPLVWVVPPHTPDLTSILLPLPVQPSQLINLERRALSLPSSTCFLNKILILQVPFLSKKKKKYFPAWSSKYLCVNKPLAIFYTYRNYDSFWWNDTFKPLYHYLLMALEKEKKNLILAMKDDMSQRWDFSCFGPHCC